MAVKNYDPKQVVVSIGGAIMQGYADGTFVTVTRLNDAFTSHAGADGEVSRAKSNDRRGEMVLTLAQTSLSNDVLSGVAAVDERTGNGIIPIAIKDLSGTTTYFSGSGWIRKIADGSFSKEIENREWTIDLASMDAFIGGSLFT